MASGEGEEGGWGLFEEPADFRPKTPPPTEVTQRLVDGSEARPVSYTHLTLPTNREV